MSGFHLVRIGVSGQVVDRSMYPYASEDAAAEAAKTINPVRCSEGKPKPSYTHIALILCGRVLKRIQLPRAS